jgi:putative peptide zinc metalloprotease protein
MTATGSIPQLRPALRPEIRIGPALLHGPDTVHLLQDPVTRHCYEVGAREHFVIARLDGTRRLAAIGEEYAQAFGRRMGEDSWRQLLGLLSGRSLLSGAPEAPVGHAGPAQVEDQDAAAPTVTGWRRARRGTVGLTDPAALLLMWHRRLRPALSWYALAPLLILVVAMEGVLATHGGRLVHQAFALRAQPELIMLDMFLLWVSLGLHELAHGLASTHFGAHPTQIGVTWRLPWVFLYCRVDDVLLLPSRRQRMAIASAGVLTNLAFLLPAFALWTLAPAGSVLESLAAFLLLLGSVGALANLLPFFRLDGQLLLSHALNVLDLPGSSWGYVRARAGGRATASRRYPRWARTVYCTYAQSQVGFIAAVLATLVLGAQAVLLPGLGERLWLAPVVAALFAAGVLPARAMTTRRTAHRRQEMTPS